MTEVRAESSFFGSDSCLKEEMSFLASTILRWTSSMMEMVGRSLATGVSPLFWVFRRRELPWNYSSGIFSFTLPLMSISQGGWSLNVFLIPSLDESLESFFLDFFCFLITFLILTSTVACFLTLRLKFLKRFLTYFCIISDATIDLTWRAISHFCLRIFSLINKSCNLVVAGKLGYS